LSNKFERLCDLCDLRLIERTTPLPDDDILDFDLHRRYSPPAPARFFPAAAPSRSIRARKLIVTSALSVLP
jgi:hypothetical protein